MGKTEFTGKDYQLKCPLDLGILQVGNGKPKIVTRMPWDPIRHMWVHLTISGDLTFERDYVRKTTLENTKQLTRHIYHLPQIQFVVQVAVIQIFRYFAAIANWESQQIVKLENLWMRAFKKAYRVNTSLPDGTFWAGPELSEQGVW